MARRRWIDPSFWDDLSISKLTPVERLFFIGCFSNADDEGRLIGSLPYLRATIFKYDDMSLEEMREIRNRAVSLNGNLVLYEVDGEEYIAFRRWDDYQKPNYPKASKLPAPPGPMLDRRRGDVEETEERGNPADMGRVGLGRDGLDRIGQGRSADGAIHSDLWREFCRQLKLIHDPIAVRDWVAGGQIGSVDESCVVVHLHPVHAEFVRVRCAGLIAEALALAAPELAEREVIIEAVERPP